MKASIPAFLIALVTFAACADDQSETTAEAVSVLVTGSSGASNATITVDDPVSLPAPWTQPDISSLKAELIGDRITVSVKIEDAGLVTVYCRTSDIAGRPYGRFGTAYIADRAGNGTLTFTFALPQPDSLEQFCVVESMTTENDGASFGYYQLAKLTINL